MPDPTIALISAVQASIAPTRAAFDSELPHVQLWNLLDDRLLEDATAQGGLTSSLRERMKRLINHAITEGASGVLLTCSLYSSVAHDLKDEAPVPVFGPDDGVFHEALSGAYRRILVVSSAAGPLADSVARLRTLASGRIDATGALAVDAAAAARAGDLPSLVDSVVMAAKPSVADIDAVVLGQYSLAPAAESTQKQLGLPVLSGPRFAVRMLRAALQERVR